MGRVIKTIATGVTFTLLLSMLGCGSGLIEQIASPNISQVLPQTIPAGSKSATMKVTGTNFTSQAVILWNGSALVTSVIDSNTLSGTITGSSLSTPATIQLQVQNANTMQESQAVPVVITPAVQGASALAITSTSLPQGTAGTAYTATLSATGGAPAYTWSIVTGQLPAGLTLTAATGVISGTPSTSGSYSFGIAATDSSSPAQAASAIITLSVGAAAPVPAPTPTPTPVPSPTPTPVPVPPPAPSPLTITTSTLAAGSQGASYSAGMQASGGVGPYNWAISSGHLPSGLGLNAGTGLISGTPISSGTFSFAISVSDSSSPAQSKSITLSITIAPTPLTITTSTLAAGTQGSSYSRNLQASGGTAPYVWTISSGSLPSGLSLNTSTGVISGTPTVSGNFSLGVTVQDSASPAQSVSGQLTFSLAAASSPLTITSTTLAGAVQNQTYNVLLNATGGTAPYKWAISSGSLPSGVSLDTGSGVISGTPVTSGTYNFAATVTDASSSPQSKSVTLSIAIAPTPLTITTSTLTAGTQGSQYSGILQASGGTAPYTWSISSGSLPSGLGLGASTGIISGTPTTSGNFSVGVTVKDSASAAQTKSGTVTFSLAAVTAPLTISPTSLAGVVENQTYSAPLNATGGTAPYRWSISSGSLPAGVSLAASTGLISGTPTVSGTFNFSASVTDASSPAQSKSITLSLVVAPTPLTIATTAVAGGTQGSNYSATLQASGGTGPYNWSISSGSLPTGVSLAASTGIISGTPTVSGTFNFSAVVTDSGSPALSKSVTLSLAISTTSLAITTSSLSSATQGSSYSKTLQASGGTSPYTWSITSGSLPTGINLAAATGIVSGTPTASGTANFVATVTDSGSPAQSKSVTLSLTVIAPSLSITSSTPASGTVGIEYSSPLTASGGTPAYTWSITTGSLPAGLSLAASSGVISGMPTTNGTSNFTVTVSDNSTPVQTKSVTSSIVVAAAAPPPGPGTTWYIRPDGGTRYSAKQTQGQCDGKADVGYSGSGTNQHCAFGDYRYLYDDQSYDNSAWVIAGGDTVIVRGGPWRIGWDAASGHGAGDTWCVGSGNGVCTNPVIPAGTAAQHTRILGENYGSCSNGNVTDRTKLTQIYGGFGVGTPLNLDGAQYVDVECLEVTRHSQCITVGDPAYPSGCKTSLPPDDFDYDGATTDVNTHDLLLQDLWIHGHTARGIKGPIGGIVTARRVDIAYNGSAGWDFDDGNSTASVNGVWNMSYSTIEWNGCNQQYPGNGAVSCYSQSTAGYGDGVGTPAGMCLSANVDHSTIRYNTQDGIDLGHIDTGKCSMSITNSLSYGNNGAAFKWGPNESPAIFTNNLAEANCLRLSQPFPGQPSTYNTNLQDFCRSFDALSFNFRTGGTLLFANNTIVTYAPTTFDIQCWDTGGCPGSTFTFENNIVLGYDNPSTYQLGGEQGGPGLFYGLNSAATVIRSNNIYYGIGHGFTCPTGYANEYCTSPLFVDQPIWTDEASLDNFNFSLSPASPAIGAGIVVPTVPLDYTGATRADPPSIGAYEK